MSDLQDALDQIKARAEKATEGTWGYYTPQGQGKDPIFGATPGDEVALVKRPADWRFIAHARADVPRLVAAIEAVLKEASDADQQDRLISPEILRKRLTEKLTGEDDDQ